MAALAADRATKYRNGDDFNYPVKASVVCYAGAIAVLDGAVVAPGRTATGLKVVGMFPRRVTGGATDGAVRAEVQRGVFQFGNSASTDEITLGSTDEITLADVGGDCFIVDDQTVAKTNGTSTRSRAGVIRDVDAGGVWVEM